MVDLAVNSQEIYTDVVVVLDGSLVRPPEWIWRCKCEGIYMFAEFSWQGQQE